MRHHPPIPLAASTATFWRRMARSRRLPPRPNIMSAMTRRPPGHSHCAARAPVTGPAGPSQVTATRWAAFSDVSPAVAGRPTGRLAEADEADVGHPVAADQGRPEKERAAATSGRNRRPEALPRAVRTAGPARDLYAIAVRGRQTTSRLSGPTKSRARRPPGPGSGR